MTYAHKLHDALDLLEKEHGRNIPVNLAYAEALAVLREAVSQAYEEAAQRLLAIYDGAPEGHDVYGDVAAVRALKPSLAPESVAS